MLPAVAQLLVWAGLSVAMSMSNKWILGIMAFNFPILLSFMHMAGAAIALNVWMWRLWTPIFYVVMPGQAAFSRETTSPDLERAHLSPGRRALAPGGQTPAHHNITVSPQQMPWLEIHGTCLLGIAVLFAGSVCLRNSAFAGLPLPVMQVLVSCAPLGTYALSAAAGLVAWTLINVTSMVLCIVGVAVAVCGRSSQILGLAFARFASGTFLEVCRVVLLQLLIRRIEGRTDDKVVQQTAVQVLQDGESRSCTFKLQDGNIGPGRMPSAINHKQTLHLTAALLSVYAPMSAAILAIPAIAMELSPAWADVVTRPPWFWACLAGNIATALALNLAAISCVQRAGVVALSLTGFVKDWILVVASTLAFGREVTVRFVGGMLVTTVAVFMYASMRAR